MKRITKNKPLSLPRAGKKAESIAACIMVCALLAMTFTGCTGQTPKESLPPEPPATYTPEPLVSDVPEQTPAPTPEPAETLRYSNLYVNGVFCPHRAYWSTSPDGVAYLMLPLEEICVLLDAQENYDAETNELTIKQNGRTVRFVPAEPDAPNGSEWICKAGGETLRLEGVVEMQESTRYLSENFLEQSLSLTIMANEQGDTLVYTAGQQTGA